MEPKELLSYIALPQNLDSQSLKQIQEELRHYPYCQTLHQLYACNLFLEGSPGFASQVKKAAVYAADRKRFKQLVDVIRISAPARSPVIEKPVVPEKPVISPPATASPPVKPEVRIPTPVKPEVRIPTPVKPEVRIPTPVKPEVRIPPPAHEIPATSPEKKDPHPLPSPVRPSIPILDPIPSASSDPVEYTSRKVAFKPVPLNDPEHGPVSVREKLLEIVHQRLAEIAREHDLDTTAESLATREHVPEQPSSEHGRISFRVKTEGGLTKDELIDRFIREEPRISSPRAALLKPLVDATEKQHEDEEIVSETLAILYRKQGNQAKSIRVYQKLCLLFPEKSSYFAARIEELRTSHGPETA